MEEELIKQQLEIDMLKEQVEYKAELVEMYKSHCEVLKQQFDKAMELLDEAVLLGKQLVK